MAKILVIDDHAGSREFLSTLLGYRGHELREADGAMEGFESARRETPDLVISDIVMPRADGYELVRLLRSDERTAMVPVMFYTAGYCRDEAAPLMKAGRVLHFLEKPAEPESILSTVDRILSEGPESQRGSAETPPAISCAEFESLHRRILTDKLAAEFSRMEEAISERRELEAELQRLSGKGEEKEAEASWRSFGLTPRETDVIRLLTRGHDNKTIAAELGVAYITARIYLQNAFRKMGARNRLDALRIALRAGMGEAAEDGER